MKKQIVATFVILVAVFSQGMAQTGILRGKVTDKTTGEELVGAAIVVDGTTTGTITNFMGEYQMPPLEPGTYNIRVQYISYEPQVKQGVVITADGETVLDFQLGTAEMDLEEVQVVAKANRESENLLLLEQKKAVMATQTVGAQEMSRKGASDAEAAVTKVSGISKQEGVKNVFVRGLGDRYNSTTLNGFALPSEDPEYKNISLDFFSSDVIKTVGVNKVFSANQTGDVGGAIINIESKELVGDRELSLNGSVGANAATFGETFLSPDGINGFGYFTETGAPTSTEAASSSYSFNNKLNPIEKNSTLNQAYGFSGGSKIGDKVTFYLIGGYNHDYFYNEGVSFNTTQNGTIYQDYDYQKYIYSTNHQLMANVDIQLATNSSITYNALYLHSNRAYYGHFEGFDEKYENTDADDGLGIMIRQQVNDNSLLVNQLYGNFQLTDRLSANVGGAYNLVLGNEPDRRINRLYYKNGDLKYLGSEGNHQRFDSELTENDINTRAIFTYKLNEDKENTKLSFGYTGRYVDRSFEADINNHGLRPKGLSQSYDPATINMDDFFNNDNLGYNNYFMVSYFKDMYTVNTTIHSGFADATIEVGEKLILAGGLRADIVDLNVDYNVNRGQTTGSSSINETYFLPSFNARYSINEKNAVRLGASKTYTLPQAKEISPFEYQDVTFRSSGYADLLPSQNYNVDIKWDYYLSNDELLTLTGFYKYITDPISRVEIASANGFLSYRNIADHAIASGLELELRKNLFKVLNDNSKKQLSLGFNGSYIYTNVKLPEDITSFYPTHDEAELEGAAPFIVNADISYALSNGDKKLSTSMVLNYTSDKMYTLGTNGYENIVEKGVPMLDFVASAKLNKHWGLKAKAANILNPTFNLSRNASSSDNNVILLDYKKGAVFSAGVTYEF
nr:TonB-dependent receptor [uncultured Carboxylicivirga sp.]